MAKQINTLTSEEQILSADNKSVYVIDCEALVSLQTCTYPLTGIKMYVIAQDGKPLKPFCRFSNVLKYLYH